jgi:glutathione peroxidase
MFEKIDVKGPDAHPLFDYLTGERRGLFGTRNVKWNFTKFLADRQGNVLERFAPKTKPEEIAGRIEALL